VRWPSIWNSVSSAYTQLTSERERALQMEIDTLTGIANRTSFARQLTGLLTDSRAATEVLPHC
jgi:PleD family two-component response regulator